MQFLIIGLDGKDDKALERRLAVRDAHIALGDKMRDAGEMLYGVALLDEADKMIGSVIICELPSHHEVSEYLKREPYVTGEVWKELEVHKCKVGPSFSKLTAASK